MRINPSKIVARMDYYYGELYSGRIAITDTEPCFALWDLVCENDPDFLRAVVETRRDLIASDREVIAFTCALAEAIG